MSTSRHPYSGSQPGSLISEITQYFTPEVVQSVRSMTGESESSTYEALRVAAPTVLSGIANMASSSQGANNLANMIREGGYAGLVDNPMSLFRGGSATSYLASAGQRQLGNIFGGNASSVTELVAKSGGVSASSASKLMSLITPLTLGVLGKRTSTQGASGLTELLTRQRDEITSAAPSGLSRILGFGPRAVPSPVATFEEDEEVVETPTHIEHFKEPVPAVEKPRVEPTPIAERPKVAAERPRTEPAILGERPAPLVSRPRGGGLKWLPFALLVLAVIALLSFLSRSRQRVGNLASRTVSTATSALARIPLPGGANISVPQGSINYQLASFLANSAATGLPKTFVFDHLNFESGSTQLSPGSDKTVSDLAQVLKAYPNALVQLTGHTDNTGNPQTNQTLSLDRANAIKTLLVNDGVGANRISTQGLGQERPVASNNTDEGRAQNRRTELTVTQK